MKYLFRLCSIAYFHSGIANMLGVNRTEHGAMLIDTGMCTVITV